MHVTGEGDENFEFPHPVSDPPKEIIKYKRDDGVELSELYTPAQVRCQRRSAAFNLGISERI